ncbi:L-alanine-DL-glutamate epimerase [Micromonospora echinofusca]|uniref:L-alanine-DL-glutamate epimerase n=1 Tax=Micromonospora echinofusca TaxID=47858 RepID=A0A1C5GI72_MICEH|nr:enolase C-terminal domain-like protein [Micromonospora echinofusca]SCG19467.1 L-alanine-DL-glutamate epimerase [Micromonospora echinofusca]
MRTEATVAVTIRELEPAPVQHVVPGWAQPWIRPDTTWPEERSSFALSARDMAGYEAVVGPLSPVVAQLVRDQFGPALSSLTTLPRPDGTLPCEGRHRSGSHFRLAQAAVDELAFRLTVAPQASRTRDTVACYATAMGFDLNAPVAPELARWLHDEGYAGQKWRLVADHSGDVGQDDLRALERVLHAASPSPVMVDAIGTWSKATARRLLPVLADLGIRWVEEPCGDLAGLGRPEATWPPIAAGEHAYEPADQWRLLGSGSVDVWQPDVGWSGGITQALATARAARELGVPTVPHGGTLRSALLLAAYTDDVTVPWLEYHLTQEPRRQRCSVDPARPAGGRLSCRSGEELRFRSGEPIILG